MLKGVLLDIDGTLIDSNQAHAEAFRIALALAGYRFQTGQILPLVGMGADKLLPELISSLTPSQIKRISELKLDIFIREFVPDLKPFAGAADLVNRLYRNHIPLAIASAADERELKPILEKIGIQYLLSQAVKSSEIQESKPAPDILEAAANKLGFAPTELIFIGDTPYDVAAASRIEMPCIAFLCGGWSQPALQGAAVFYAGPWELLQKWEDSPLHEIAPDPSPILHHAGGSSNVRSIGGFQL